MRAMDHIVLVFIMAFRNVMRQKRRSLIVALTAFVGIFSVIMTQAFMNGFFDSMVTVAIRSGLGHVQIRPQGYLDSRNTNMKIEDAGLENQFAAKLDQTTGYAGRIEREAILKVGNEIQGILLMGVDPQRESRVSDIPSWVKEGDFFPADRNTPDKQYHCLLGRKNSKALEIEKGDWVIVSTGSLQGETRTIRCTISGVFEAPSPLIEEKVLIMQKQDLSRLINQEQTDVTSYYVFSGSSMEKADAIQQSLLGLVKSDGLEILTFSELEPTISSYFELVDQFTWVFYFIIQIGFGVVLFESVTMSIFERMREIGIMHAIGTSPVFLFVMVILEAFFMTMAGVLLSIIFASVFSAWLSVSGIDFKGMDFGMQMSSVSGLGVVYPYLKFSNLLESFNIAVVVSLLSGIYPALKAVRISPIKAIYNR